MSVVEVAIIGIGVVFLVLAILTGATIILGKFCQSGKNLQSTKIEGEAIEKTIEKGKLIAMVSTAIVSYLSKKPNQIMINSINQINSNSPKEG